MLQEVSGRALLLCAIVCAAIAKDCPDKRTCEEGQTCCLMSGGSYGCCPFPSAVCCSDKEHCCPNGHTCDLLHDRCVSENIFQYSVTPLGRSTPASPKSDENDIAQHPKFNKLMMLLRNQSDQKCPDGSHCDDKATCCKDGHGFACCPSPNAVCCSDQKHCCPHGTTCDTASSTCRKGEYSPSGMLIISESGLQQLEFGGLVKNVVCPGGQDSCPDGSTCCQLEGGDFGCCPFNNAVCCSDHAHCCPSGAECDLVQDKCVFPFKTLEWAQKMTSWTNILPKAGIVCPDHKTRCKQGTTCCATPHSYACCPYDHAVCCPDKAHCCPAKTHCNTQAQTCDNTTRGNNVAVPWATKTPALPISLDIESGVICPGGSSQCEDGQTCCQLRSGDWGCCPLPNAVCCSDGEHCCAAGYTCTAQGKCRPN